MAKKVTVLPADPQDEELLYAWLEEERQHHPDLEKAAILLAWNESWKPDRDGRLVLGKCRKVPELYQRITGFAFIIELNREAWARVQAAGDPGQAEKWMRRLLDHELSHAAPDLDDNMQQRADESGRLLWRTVKHDVEDFAAVQLRHGYTIVGQGDFFEMARQGEEFAQQSLRFGDEAEEAA